MKPILFNTDMVRAILPDRKTVTRRVVKPQPIGDLYPMPMANEWPNYHVCTSGALFAPPYHPGDILYVRETWTKLVGSYIYKADQKPNMKNPGKWRPSIHMPREAARIFLRVTDVRVERLQEISAAQAKREGVSNNDPYDYQSPEWFDHRPELLTCVEKAAFAGLWNSTIKPADRAIYGWDANPWVWVIEFERISREEATQSGS